MCLPYPALFLQLRWQRERTSDKPCVERAGTLAEQTWTCGENDGGSHGSDAKAHGIRGARHDGAWPMLALAPALTGSGVGFVPGILGSKVPPAHLHCPQEEKSWRLRGSWMMVMGAVVLLEILVGDAVEGESRDCTLQARGNEAPGAPRAAPAGETFVFDPDQALFHTSILYPLLGTLD